MPQKRIGMKRNLYTLCLWALVALAAPAAAAGSTGSTDKSRYTLFNPTPRGLMRPLATDESPYTVDAGHFQAEIALAGYAYNRVGRQTTGDFVAAVTTFKAGLLHNLDLHLIVEPYVHSHAEGPDGEAAVNDGFGSTLLRLKLNAWGNDGGNTALALIPYVQFPTTDEDLGGTDRLEGGLVVPLTIILPDRWELLLTAGVGFLRDDEDAGYGAAFTHSAQLWRPITEALGGYVEYVGAAHDGLDSGYLALIGGGLLYAFGPDVALDGTVYFGLNDLADDFAAQLVLSFRI
jgi:hypothetical protein